MKKTNKKGFYKEGRLTFKEVHGEPVLVTQVRIKNADLIQYLKDIDQSCDGSISASQILGALATLAFKSGIRLDQLSERS